uniref:Endoplasmic reticulum transmembrane protein n=1 Tax=Oryza meridionalis TaxID=40149 RepID=A0A0E0DYB3_9ORYZ
MSLAATFVFLLVSALQMLDQVLDLVKKRGSITDDQLKLRLEITQILKEASALSTPSTFAQAAKLKRLAAAKEKELAKLQQQDIKGKQSLYNQYGRVMLFSKDGCFPGEVSMLLQAVLWLELSHGYF